MNHLALHRIINRTSAGRASLPLRTAVTLLGFALLGLSLGGCQEKKSNKEIATQAQKNLNACDLMTTGTLNADAANEATLCIFECYGATTDCGQLEAAVCREEPWSDPGNNSVFDCEVECSAFTCDDGSYVDIETVCNGSSECADGSDEADCQTCDEGTVVLAEASICDSWPDCADGSDEEDCVIVNSFKCDDGSEIPEAWQCDAAADCEDGSDEKDCPGGTFTCGDGMVIPGAWECDLTADCADDSDEGEKCAKIRCSEE